MFSRKGRLHLVFEFVDKNLLEVLTENYPRGFDYNGMRTCVWQIVRALEYCHRHDVIHRDIKPENILVNLSDMCIKLCDFGFARTIPVSGSLTDYVATRWYRPPELLLGSTTYGPGIDMFATGCIMSELIDGQPLLPGESEIDQLALIHRVIGPLTSDQRSIFVCNPRFVGSPIPYNPTVKCVSLEERYSTVLPKKGLLFLRYLLAIDSRDRISADQCLRHAFFDGIANYLPRQLRPNTVSLPPRNACSRQSSTESVREPAPKLNTCWIRPSKLTNFSYTHPWQRSR